jgi:hypothetical protein
LARRRQLNDLFEKQAWVGLMTDPTDQTTPDTATEALTVPPAIEAVIQHFDALDKSFTEFDVGTGHSARI